MADSTRAARSSELDRDEDSDSGLADAAAEIPLVVRAHLVTMVLYGVGLAAVLFVLLFPRFVLFVAVLAAGAWGYVKLYGLVERKMSDAEGLPVARSARQGEARKEARPGSPARPRRTKKAAGAPAASSMPAAADGGTPDVGPDVKSGS